MGHIRVMSVTLGVLLTAIILAGCGGGDSGSAEVRNAGAVDARVEALLAYIGEREGFAEWADYGAEQQRRGVIRVVPDTIMQARVEARAFAWLDGLTLLGTRCIWLSGSLWERRSSDRCAAILLHELAHLRLDTLDETQCDDVVRRWQALATASAGSAAP